MFYLFPLVPGLIARQFFNLLSQDARADFGLWSLVALLVGAEITRLAANFLAVLVETTVQLTGAALVRKNIFDYILERPGASRQPTAPGEAVSRFRDDLKTVSTFLTWSSDPVGQVAVFVIAITVLSSVNFYLTADGKGA